MNSTQYLPSESAAILIEQAALRELHAAADARLSNQLGMHLREKDGLLMSAFSHDPGIVLNRASGLGVSSAVTPQQIEAVVDFYRQAGIRRFFLQDHPRATPAERNTWLAQAGLEKQRPWMKFRHSLDTLPPPSPHLAVEPVDAQRARECANIIVHGFDLQTNTAELLVRMMQRPNWQPVMVCIDGKVAGVACLYIRHGTGWCDWAATHPDYRARGVQSALLAERLRGAKIAGCHAVFATTGAAVPGDSQHSYNNLLRAGFREDYLADNYAPV